jgi:hypothetical protein
MGKGGHASDKGSAEIFSELKRLFFMVSPLSDLKDLKDLATQLRVGRAHGSSLAAGEKACPLLLGKGLAIVGCFAGSLYEAIATCNLE